MSDIVVLLGIVVGLLVDVRPIEKYQTSVAAETELSDPVLKSDPTQPVFRANDGCSSRLCCV